MINPGHLAVEVVRDSFILLFPSFCREGPIGSGVAIHSTGR